MENVTLNKWDKQTIVSFISKGSVVQVYQCIPKNSMFISQQKLLYHYIHILRKRRVKPQGARMTPPVSWLSWRQRGQDVGNSRIPR